MTASRWKRSERAIAREGFGVERNPNDGRPRADCETALFAVQVKTRLALPGWLWAAVDQARGDAHGKVPVVVLAEVRQGVKARRLVVVDWDAWLDLHGPTPMETR